MKNKTNKMNKKVKKFFKQKRDLIQLLGLTINTLINVVMNF